MKRSPTDLKILDAIYDRYYDVFSNYEKDPSSRSSKIYVPIDIALVAKDLRMDGDIIFGRLYYHLEDRYGYAHEDGSRVHFFAMQLGGDRHCVNFPYVASVLANLRDEDRKFNIAISVAIASLFVSVIAIGISILL